ncbi:MAG: FecR family protein, partial [Bacteroides sp.]
MNTELLHLYFKGDATEQEENQIVEWVESSTENKERFFRERMLFDAALFSNVPVATKQRKKRMYLYTSVAAAVAILIFAFIINFPTMNQAEQLSQTIRIPAGQRAQMVLPDGSIVWLNSQTTLTYDADFGKTKRNVTLDGEAYFEVAHNKEIPFYVQTEDIKIQVTGTKFDVCSYKGSHYFITRLIEGSI